MPKLTWKFLQIPLLAVTFSGVALVLAKTALAPKPDKTAEVAQSNTAPTTVPLKDWQPLGTTTLERNEELSKESRVAQRYRYRSGAQELDIEMQYMVSDGNISRYLFVYTPIRTANSNLKIKHQSGIGHYGLVTHVDSKAKTGKAYLSACINPRGESTATEQQFTHNLSSELNPVRVVLWLLGQESLVDRRCLWTLMSIPVALSPDAKTVSGQSQAEAYTALETAWTSWHQWWRGNYPRF